MTRFRTSDMLIEKIKVFEGLRLVAYKAHPTERWYTIGYGHYAGDVTEGMRITKERAEELLRRDLMAVERFCNDIPELDTQGKFDAVCDFVYNLGAGNFKRSTLYRSIKHHAPVGVIQREFRKWVRAGGKVLKGLVKRREWEARRWAE